MDKLGGLSIDLDIYDLATRLAATVLNAVLVNINFMKIDWVIHVYKLIH